MMAQLSMFINVPRLVVQIILSLWISIKFGLYFWMILTLIELVYEISGIIKYVLLLFRSYNRVKKLTDTMKNLKKVTE